MSPPTLPRLHLITDHSDLHPLGHVALARAAQGLEGVALQYRRKDYQPSLHAAEAHAVARLCHEAHIPLIVNDWLDLALELGAQGVHLGQGDAHPAEALQRMPPGSWVGATVHTPAEYEAVAHLPLSYIGVGPVFDTLSKRIALPALGLEGLSHVCTLSRVPVVAIGGISHETAAGVLGAGAWGVAVLGAWCAAARPHEAALHLAHTVRVAAGALPGPWPKHPPD